MSYWRQRKEVLPLIEHSAIERNIAQNFGFSKKKSSNFEEEKLFFVSKYVLFSDNSYLILFSPSFFRAPEVEGRWLCSGMTHNIIFRSFTSCIWPSQHFCIWRKIFTSSTARLRGNLVLLIFFKFNRYISCIFQNTDNHVRRGMHHGTVFFIWLWESGRWGIGWGITVGNNRIFSDGETHTPFENRAQVSNSEEVLWGGKGFNPGRWAKIGTNQAPGKPFINIFCLFVFFFYLFVCCWVFVFFFLFLIRINE